MFIAVLLPKLLDMGPRIQIPNSVRVNMQHVESQPLLVLTLDKKGSVTSGRASNIKTVTNVYIMEVTLEIGKPLLHFDSPG